MAGEAARPGRAADVAELIALIDRLEPMLAASGLDEVEIGVGDTTLVLRTPVVPTRGAQPGRSARSIGPDARDTAGGKGAGAPRRGHRSALRRRAPHRRVLPLAVARRANYVKVGGEVIAGQVIGLLEAMKLFNEIKSDVTGVVRRIVAENGALVKTHQVLIEVEPT